MTACNCVLPDAEVDNASAAAVDTDNLVLSVLVAVDASYTPSALLTDVYTVD